MLSPAISQTFGRAILGGSPEPPRLIHVLWTNLYLSCKMTKSLAAALTLTESNNSDSDRQSIRQTTTTTWLIELAKTQSCSQEASIWHIADAPVGQPRRKKPGPSGWSPNRPRSPASVSFLNPMIQCQLMPNDGQKNVAQKRSSQVKQNTMTIFKNESSHVKAPNVVAVLQPTANCQWPRCRCCIIRCISCCWNTIICCCCIRCSTTRTSGRRWSRCWVRLLQDTSQNKWMHN